MPFKNYSAAEKTEALEVIAQHADNIQVAQAELMQRWGYAPSPSTLSTWLLSGQGGHSKGNVHQCRGTCRNGTLKGLEGGEKTPWESLLEAVRQLAEDPDYLVVIVSKRGGGSARL